MEHMLCLEFNVKTISTVENDPPCMEICGENVLLNMIFPKAHENVALDDRTLEWKLD